ncbi:MSCRAMM family protein [Agromyces humatus]|uniref:SpaA-like prealbumin fold domain-containing protein n=1 Tax=Agromyces humatus TaxID=279573 RepID=A0ABP4X2H9_9MICO|nr:prealbumin-like fold domain-containing protein [Agromyces humatus]
MLRTEAAQNCPTPPTRRRRRRSPIIAAAAAGALIFTGLAVAPAQAAHPEVSLPGSDFEIDTDANLKVDDPAPSIDWANVIENRQADLATGSGDDSFGQGAKEDTAVPTVVDGSIPPNKSDLLNFGTYLEESAAGDFLHMFWHRVQEPNGTTNMDFEFNQSETLSGNNVTPLRTEGDILIQYDLSQGGTNPQLFVAYWLTDGTFNPPNPDQTVTTANCVSSNAFPCWGLRANLTSSGDATGSINTTAIPAAESDGLSSTNPVSARTFGEATVDFSAIVGDDECVSFGSAYLKSRSSDSFTAALKDFIRPADVDLTNCAKVIIHKETDPDGDTTSFDYTTQLVTQDDGTSPGFSLTDGGTQEYDNVFFGTDLTVTESAPPAGWSLIDIDCSASVGVTVGPADISLATGTVTFDLDDADDVLECTYTNQAKGTVIVEKVTNDGFGPFDFTSGTLPDAAFTLTTTAAGSAGKDSNTYANLTPGTYDVSETVPANWNLVSETCDDASDPQSISLSAGETVTCTFVNEREKGSIKIVKTRKHAASGPGDHPHANVTFTVTGGNLSQGIVVQTNASGIACVPNLVVSALVGNYTVTETVPTGYVALSTNPQTAAVSESAADCSNTPAGATKTFENMPLTNLTVSVDSQIDGGTASTIDCDAEADPPFEATTNANGDGSLTKSNLQPGTYTCVIVIDP